MSRLDELPPDQRAALSLLLRQRKSYAEVADLLHIPARAVHDRAHAALAVLAPRAARGLDPAQRLEVGDYLLGQQGSISERLRTRTYLGTSEPAREWARAVAAELAPLTNGHLPEIPVDAPGARAAIATRPADRRGRPSQPGAAAPSSRLGGALILAAIVVAIAVTVVLLLTGGNSHHKKPTTSSSATTGPRVHQIVMHAPDKGKQVGVLEVLAEGSKRAFYIEADNLPESKGFFYAIWLYNSPKSALPLSKANVGPSHQLAGGALLPTNAGSYHEVLLTRQTNPRPRRPGAIVLKGAFSL